MLRILVGIGALQLLAVLVNFARTKVTALLVGPEGVGIISVIDQTVQFVAHTCALSLPFATVKFLSKAHSEGAESFREGYGVFFTVLLWFSSLGAAAVAGVALFRIELFPTELIPYQAVLIVSCLGIPGTVLAGFFPNVLAAAQQSTSSARLTLFIGMAVAGCATVGLAVGGILGLYVGSVLAVSVAALAVTRHLRRILGLSLQHTAATLRERFGRLGNVASFSALFYIGALTSTGSFLVTRYAVLQYFGDAEAGFLQAAMAVALLMNVVLNPLNGLFLTPHLNRTNPKEEKFRTTMEFQRQFAMILTIVALPMVLFPHILLMLAFSSKFLIVAPYVFVFVLWQLFANMAGVYQALLIGLDDMVPYTVCTAVGNLLAGGVAVALVPNYGVVGAGVAFAGASLLLTIATYLWLRWSHGLQLQGHLLSLMGYSVAVLTTLGLLFRDSGEWNAVVVLSKIGVALLAATGLLLFLTKEEKLALWSFPRKVLAGTR